MKRHELIAHRRARTVGLGPSMRLQFEDALTVRHQVAEVLRTERVTDPAAVQHEIDTYAFLLPQGMEWTATLLIELPDAAQRARELPHLSPGRTPRLLAMRGHGAGLRRRQRRPRRPPSLAAQRGALPARNRGDWFTLRGGSEGRAAVSPGRRR